MPPVRHLGFRSCMGNRLGRQGTRKDVRDATKLQVGHLRKGDVVEVRPVGQVQLLVVEAPVQVGQGALLLNLGLDVGQLKADSAIGLLADEGNVPLF